MDRASSSLPALAQPRILALIALLVAAPAGGCGSDSSEGARGPSALTCTLGTDTLRPGESSLLVDGAACERCVCSSSGELRCVAVACPPPDDAADVRDPEDVAGEDTIAPDSDVGETSDVVPADTWDDEVFVPGPIEAGGCPCPVGTSSSPEAFLSAIGVCGDGVRSVGQAVGDPQQRAVVQDYFGILGQRTNCMAVLSTGRADAPARVGTAFNPDGVQPGTGFSEARFPNPRPSGGDGVLDLAQIRVELAPPPNARGFEFNFMFFSAEWPEYLCQQYNDAFLTLLDSRANPEGRVRNVSFDQFGNEVSVNISFFEAPHQWTVDLRGTPFGLRPAAPPIGLPLPGLAADRCPGASFRSECTLPAYCRDGTDLNYVGSGTGWLRTTAPIEAGEETITLTFSIHDEGDNVYDSLVLIEGFRWLNYAPETGTGKL